MCGESNMETYITMCKIGSQQEFAVWLRKLKEGLCITLKEWDGGETGGRVNREGTYAHLWLIHADSKKRAKLCRTIILQLKNKYFFKENEIRTFSNTMHKKKLKMYQRPKCKTRNYKILRGKHRTLFDINHSNIFFDPTPREWK